MITLPMQYRYDPADYNCEVFEYARTRAAHFYRFHRNRYLGDRDDLEQTAIVAVVEAINSLEDKTTVPEDLLIEAVDTALGKGVRSSKKQSPIQVVAKGGAVEDEVPLEHLILQRCNSYATTALTDDKLQRFNKLLDRWLTKEQLDMLWDVMVYGMSIEDKVIQLRSRQVGKGKWERPTKGKVRRLLEEAISTIHYKLPPQLIEEIATLPFAQELSP